MVVTDCLVFEGFRHVYGLKFSDSRNVKTSQPRNLTTSKLQNLKGPKDQKIRCSNVQMRRAKLILPTTKHIKGAKKSRQSPDSPPPTHLYSYPLISLECLYYYPEYLLPTLGQQHCRRSRLRQSSLAFVSLAKLEPNSPFMLINCF